MADARIAFTQFAAGSDKSVNLAAIRAAVADAAGSADLVVFPENSMFTVATAGEPWLDAAEPLDGAFVAELRALAQEHGVTIVAGMTERTDDTRGRVANTTVVVSPAGDLIGVYRKAHLYDAFGFRESDYTVPADRQPFSFDLDGVQIGLMTCYDIRFPESARLLADAGVDVIVIPAAWAAVPGKEAQWRVLAQARATENVCYVVAVSQTGPISAGHSVAVDPLGTVIAAATEQQSTTVVAVATERVAEARVKNPSLWNRRLGVHVPDEVR
ncbi:carbon-nitrogen hydrolase family protein [Microbacterium foliorum]|uniref:Carbon-nitrogen hydrolase family protein n=1 Tax=Microbacterium foliorum TaxID=104336 RepID=A0A4Y5YQH0_9MICO|nr:carbon-nitrogen hydrolase family protein [Microbacterium foliorum]QDE34848.1 carbon-nitrogen hydrolase family protein [Microbacterium foliorum]